MRALIFFGLLGMALACNNRTAELNRCVAEAAFKLNDAAMETIAAAVRNVTADSDLQNVTQAIEELLLEANVTLTHELQELEEDLAKCKGPQAPICAMETLTKFSFKLMKTISKLGYKLASLLGLSSSGVITKVVGEFIAIAGPQLFAEGMEFREDCMNCLKEYGPWTHGNCGNSIELGGSVY